MKHSGLERCASILFFTGQLVTNSQQIKDFLIAQAIIQGQTEPIFLIHVKGRVNPHDHS